MSNIKIFENAEFGTVRTMTIDGEPWFVGKDIAEILGYERTDNAIRKHVDTEDKLTHQISALGQNRNMYIINESGLYSLILSSKMPNAKKFKHWITSEVLPSIRKHGAYMTAEKLEEVILNPDTMIKLCQNLKEEREKNKKLLNDITRMKPKEIFADSVATSTSSILVGELAKILKQNGVEIGAKRLFAWLRENGFLIKRQGSEYNLPTQKSMELKLFEIKETSISHSDGHISVIKTPKVTGKGQIYFVNLFNSIKTEMLTV